MDKYRKLTKAEIEDITSVMKSSKRFSEKQKQELKQYIDKYYPNDNIAAAVFQFSNEYNDQGYEHKTQYLMVIDREGNEVYPIQRTAREARRLWDTFIYIDETEHELDDETVYFTEVIPELYVKVK